MRIPYVIDNQSHKLADALNASLAERAGNALDIATAYFNVGGYRLLRGRLHSGDRCRKSPTGFAICWAKTLDRAWMIQKLYGLTEEEIAVVEGADE